MKDDAPIELRDWMKERQVRESRFWKIVCDWLN